jgi:hypothetical protein
MNWDLNIRAKTGDASDITLDDTSSCVLPFGLESSKAISPSGSIWTMEVSPDILHVVFSCPSGLVVEGT